MFFAIPDSSYQMTKTIMYKRNAAPIYASNILLAALVKTVFLCSSHGFLWRRLVTLCSVAGVSRIPLFVTYQFWGSGHSLHYFAKCLKELLGHLLQRLLYHARHEQDSTALVGSRSMRPKNIFFLDSNVDHCQKNCLSDEHTCYKVSDFA